MSSPDWLISRPIAHRGWHDHEQGIAENSLPAIQRAIRGGFAIELDVRMSRDGGLVVFHDDTLERLTSAQGFVEEQPLEMLCGLALGDHSGTLPSLSMALAEIAGQVPVFLDLKAPQDGDDARFLGCLFRDLERYHGEVALMSFEPILICNAQKRVMPVPTGLLLDTIRPIDLICGRPDFLGVDVALLPSTALPASLPRLAWTVKTAHDLAKAKASADQVIFEGPFHG